MRVTKTEFLSSDGAGNFICYQEIYGNSKESKPTKGIATGSKFTAVDTSKIYRFDESTTQWYLQETTSTSE